MHYMVLVTRKACIQTLASHVLITHHLPPVMLTTTSRSSPFLDKKYHQEIIIHSPMEETQSSTLGCKTPIHPYTRAAIIVICV